MMINSLRRLLTCALALCFVLGNSPENACAAKKIVIRKSTVQEQYPPLPDDLTRIYLADAANKLVPLPFEAISTRLQIGVKAQIDKAGYVELKGTQAATVIANAQPRFYLFVNGTMDPPPHSLVRLAIKSGARRFSAVVDKDGKRFVPFADQTVKLDYRILEQVLVETSPGRQIFVNYIEARPRESLTLGEYTFIGNNVVETATFRFATSTN